MTTNHRNVINQAKNHSTVPHTYKNPLYRRRSGIHEGDFIVVKPYKVELGISCLEFPGDTAVEFPIVAVGAAEFAFKFKP